MQRILFWANLALFFVLLFLVGLALGDGRTTRAAGSKGKSAALQSFTPEAAGQPREMATPESKAKIHLFGLPDWKRKVEVQEGGLLKLEKWPMDLGLGFESLANPFPIHFEVLDRSGQRTKVRVETSELAKDGLKLNLWGLHPIGKRFTLRGSLGRRTFEFRLEGPAPNLKSARIFPRGKPGSYHYHVRLGLDVPVALSTLRPLLEVETMSGQKLPFSLRTSLGKSGVQVDRDFILSPEAKTRSFVDNFGVAKLRLRLRPGLRLLGEEVRQQKAISRELVWGGPIRLKWIRGGSHSLRLHFGKPLMGVDPSTIVLRPKVPFELETSDEGVNLKAPFHPGRVYHLTLAKGFPGSGSFRLAQKEERSFRIPDLEWRGQFLGQGTLLSSAALPEIQIQGVNLSKAKLELRKVLPGNALAFLRNPNASIVDRAFLGEPRAKVFPVRAKLNENFRRRLDLTSLLPRERTGLYLLRLYPISRRGDLAYWPKSKLLQITNLGAQIRRGAGTLVARVHQLDDAAEVESALVRVLSGKNQVIAFGMTDSHGICRLEWVRGKGRAPRIVEIRKGSDQTFVDLENESVELSGPGFAGKRGFLAEGKVEAFAWTDRGIVRPGREVRAIFLVQDAGGRAPLGVDLKLQWRRPGGRVFRTQELRVPADGFLRAALQLPSYAESGRWGVELLRGKERVGAVGFAVKAFVPDRIETRGGFEGEAVLGRSALLFTEASWLDGGAAAGLKMRAEIYLRQGTHRLRLAGKDWTLGTLGKRPKKLPSFEPKLAVLGKDGKRELRIPLPQVPGDQGDLGAWAQLSLSARVEVTDPAGRSVGTWARTVVKAPKRLLLRRAGERSVEALLVDPKERVMSGRVSLRLERRWWRSEFQIDANGIGRSHFNLQRQVLREARLSMGPKGLHWELPKIAAKKRDGAWLVLVAVTKGAYSELSLSKAQKPGAKLRVIAGRQRWEAGGKLRLRVQSPVAGKALLTFEDRKVLGGQEVSLQKGWNELELRLPKVRATPNLYAVLGIVAAQRGRVLGPFSWTGGARILLDRKSRILYPQVTLAKEVRPGALLRVRVRAEGARRAMVALVDQGILRITGHRDPNPKGFFLGSRRLGTRGADSNLAMMEGARFTQEHATGGGAGGNPFGLTGPLAGTISPWIQPVALASQLLFAKPGEPGIFDAQFRLPRDYEGRLRVFVIAAGSRATGASSRDLVVRSPLSIRLAGPRRMSPGDRCQLSLVVRNLTGKKGRLHLDLKGRGGLEVLGQSALELPMKLGEQKVLSVAVRAGKGGAAPSGLEVLGKLGKETRSCSLHLDVRPTLFPIKLLLGMSLEKGRHEVEIPSSLAAEGRSLRIRVGGSPLDRLRPAYRSLQGYPYGCVEQTASKARVLLVLSSSLHDNSEGGERGPLNVREKIGYALDRIAGMATYRGMGFWGRYDIHPLPTLHSLELALDAMNQGMGRMPAGWQNILRRIHRDSWGGGDQAMKAWSLFVLQKANYSTRRYLEDELLPSLVDPFGRCWAALALQGLGEEQRAKDLLRGLQADSFGMGRPYLTPIVGQALLLRALQKLAPADPRVPPLAEGLVMACRRPGALTTFEMANALMALADYEANRFDKNRVLGVKLHWQGRSKLLQDGDEVHISIPAGQRGPVLESIGKAFVLLEWRGFESPQKGLQQGLQQGLQKGLRQAGLVPTKKGNPGLRIQRQVFVEGTKTLAKSFQRGLVYEVRIRVDTDGDLANFCLADPFSGGMEAEDVPSSVFFSAKPGVGKGSAERQALSFRRERRDDRILFFLSRGRGAGSYEFRYRLRAITKGTFAKAPPRLEALYQPGRVVYGRPEAAIEVR